MNYHAYCKMRQVGPHQIVAGLRLKHGGVLHRFSDAEGKPCSAIYVEEKKVLSCERNREQDMLRCWASR